MATLPAALTEQARKALGAPVWISLAYTKSSQSSVKWIEHHQDRFFFKCLLFCLPETGVQVNIQSLTAGISTLSK